MAENKNHSDPQTQNRSLNIKEWAEEDRPREKFLLKGKASLSDAELIAILIGSGNATMSAVDLAKLILKETGNDLNQLAKLSISDLTRFKGMGEAKSISIAAALELGRRRKESATEEKPKIDTAKKVYDLMGRDLIDLPYEEFWLLCLNQSSQLVGKEMLGRGGITSVFVDFRLLFKKAISHLSTSIIVVHNHPTGSLNPSREDVKLTQRLKDACQLLDIILADHIIFSDSGFYSFADKNNEVIL